MKTIMRPMRFDLPNGVAIDTVLSGDKANDLRGEWKSIDINATYPDGKRETLCAVDWEAGRGTRTLVFEHGNDEPVYMQLYREIDDAGAADESNAYHEADVRLLACQISLLDYGDVLKFYADKDGNEVNDCYGVTRFEAFDAVHILINYYGGCSPYIIDVTTTEDETTEIEDALNAYFDYCGINAPVYISGDSIKANKASFSYLISAEGNGAMEARIKALMKSEGFNKVEATSQMDFTSFLETLPAVCLPGIAYSCRNWLRLWGNGGGDYSTEECGKSACTTDNPRELAQAIYDSIEDYSKTPFEARLLVMNIFEDSIGDTADFPPINPSDITV